MAVTAQDATLPSSFLPPLFLASKNLRNQMLLLTDKESFFLPDFLAALLAWFLPSFIPSFLPSLPPSVHASVLPSFLPSLLPSFPAWIYLLFGFFLMPLPRSLRPKLG